MIVFTWVRLWRGDHYDCFYMGKTVEGDHWIVSTWVRLCRGDHYDCFYMGKTVEGGSL